MGCSAQKDPRRQAADVKRAMADARRDGDLRPDAVPGGPPEAQAAISDAGCSPEVLGLFQALLDEGGAALRGGAANPDRPYLQALQNLVGWTIGGYDTRPVPEAQAAKDADRLKILLRYRQPADPGTPPVVAMYDYICETIFGVPMQRVGAEVVQPTYQDLDGNFVEAEWFEADLVAYREARAGRPTAPVLLPNLYPYQLPRRPGRREEEQTAQHWILWYFHYREDPLPDPSDAEIDADLRRALAAVLQQRGLGPRADYIWYRNPAMSVPQVFHVQVFWILPAEPD